MMPRPSPVNAHIPWMLTPASPVAPPSVASCPGSSFSTTVRSVGTTGGYRLHAGVAQNPLPGDAGDARSVLHAEAELERHLVVVHRALVVEVAAHFGDLEPVEVAQRLARPDQGNVDRLLDRLRRRSDDLAD